MPMTLRWRYRAERRTPYQRGATLVEMVIVLPLLLFIVLAIMQAALVFYARSNVTYATFEAARAGTVSNARLPAITAAFRRGLVGYYGGGRTPGELAATSAKVAADVTDSALRIEILSPSEESFIDYNSPRLQSALHTGDAVIPNVGLDELTCPRDVPACNSDPHSNASGQTLLDANLLKLRVTYGIPPAKQMPVVGRFYTWALNHTGAGHGDAFKQALIAAGRIPIVTHTVMRMQSDAIRNVAMVSAPGPGNEGAPVDPGPGPGGAELPACPWWDPACVSCADGTRGVSCGETPVCDPATDPDRCRPAECREGDPDCASACFSDACCMTPL